MAMPIPQVRRATVEDLPKLAPLWQSEKMPIPELEKRWKEFQVVEGEGGAILGTFGLQVTGTDGVVHSEVFTAAGESDELRRRLWERARVLIKNHGLARIWVQSPSAFWLQEGFQQASPEQVAQIPPGSPANERPWLYLQLREESTPAATLDREFALFKESERESTERLMRQARVMKIVAGVVALALMILVAIWAIKFFEVRGKISPR